MNKSFSLPLHDISIGTILTEASRGGLHSMAPSAFISRIMEGVRQYRAEMINHEDTADMVVMSELEHKLLLLREHMKKQEDATYVPDGVT